MNLKSEGLRPCSFAPGGISRMSEGEGFLLTMEPTWTCSLCGHHGTELEAHVSNPRTLRKIENKLKTTVKAVCAPCRQRIKSFGAATALPAMGPILAAIEQIKAGGIPCNVEDLYEESKKIRRMVSYEVSVMLNKLQHATETLNLITSAGAELKTRHVENLWATYPERRKRADYAISEKNLRRMIFHRDGYRCKSCGGRKKLTVDHIKPVVLGGGDEPENLQTLCGPCNSSKGGREQ